MNIKLLATAFGTFAMAAHASGNTYYLTASDYFLGGVNNSGYYANAAMWEDAAGNKAGAEGSALSSEDYFVVRGGLTLRTKGINNSAEQTTTFTCKRITFGDLDDGTEGTFLCYGQAKSPVYFATSASQDGVWFAKGKLQGPQANNCTCTLHGPITLVSPAATPFWIYSTLYNSMLIFTGDLTASAGTGLKIGGQQWGDANSPADSTFTVSFTGDLSAFAGTMTVEENYRNAKRWPTVLSLGPGGFPNGNLVMGTRTRLVVESAERPLGFGSLSLADGVSIDFSVTNAVVDGVFVPKCSTIEVSGDLSVAGTVTVTIGDIPANGETNHLALLTSAGGGIDADAFAIVPPDDFYYVGKEVVTNAETGAQTLCAVFEPVVRLVVSDRQLGDKTGNNIKDSLTNALCWSDKRVPHADAHYLVLNDAAVSSRETDWEWGVKMSYVRTPVMNGGFAFGGKSLTLGADTRLTTLSTGFSVPVLRVLDGAQIYAGQLTTTVFSNMDFVVDSGVARICAYYANGIHLKGRLKGNGQIAMGQKGNAVRPGADYSFRGDNSEWRGTMVVTQRVDVAEADAFTDSKYYQRLQLGASSDIGARLEEFRPDALVLSKYSQLIADDVDIAIPTNLNRGLSVYGVGRILARSGRVLSLGMPLTIDGVLYKQGDGILKLDADRHAVGAGGGAIVVTNGTLAVSAVDAVNGFAVHIAPNTALSLKVNLADVELTRYGIRNVGLAEPFVLGAGMTALPLSVDVTDGGELSSKGAVVGVLTVSDSATNLLDSVVAVPRTYRGFKFSSVKIHDDENGWTTYAACYEPTGCVILIK